MKTTADLDFVAKLPASQTSKMLSIYLDVQSRSPGRLNQHYEGELLRKLESIQKQLSDKRERRNFLASARRVKHFMAKHKPKGRGLIVFSSDHDQLFWWRDISVPVASEVHWNTLPRIRPLLELADEFERYGVILTDREEARLFTVFMGEIEHHLEIRSSARVKHIKKAGAERMFSQTQFERTARLHALWHLKKVAKLAQRQMSLKALDRLVLAGPSEATSVLVGSCPNA